MTDDLLHCIDILVDGRFLREEKDISLQFRGSRNQRIIDLPRTLSSDRIVLWDQLLPIAPPHSFPISSPKRGDLLPEAAPLFYTLYIIFYIFHKVFNIFRFLCCALSIPML